ncbi:DUF1800 domain-containing protein [Alteromonas sp. 5E99-2]|uniref:DUF1800 domain-containing protein n=1 Tax=Alteromonas sp. 5E99-2 TaxID=2817683 RepID=UPI001A985A6A|nr:DUF1800 domain-containing protein [Alteromonas sp. 5E99-2]MBO1256050.1 DUF1800 domain-containing protein [Alteromonas sp. 5E99-2]
MKVITPSLLVFLLLLSGCGGGDSSNQEPAPIADPQPVPAPPPIAVEPPTRAQAAQLLNQGSFGPRTSDIDNVVALGIEGWIDSQINAPSSSHAQGVNNARLIEGVSDNQTVSRERRIETWWEIALQGEDQLRQRVAFALSEILVVSENSVFNEDTLGIALYYDILVNHAFGNYRDLLEDITLSPIMGLYLSMLGNQAPDNTLNIRPDENFARESMQLFSIGLVELNLDGTLRLDENGLAIPTYNQDIIENYARVYTGWNFAGANEQTFTQFSRNYNSRAPMQPIQAFHDTNAKTLLNNTFVPQGQTAEQDLAIALDSLFNHQNVAPFMSKQLIQKLVTSNPTPAYVERVARVFNDDGNGVRGNLAAVVKALLMDEEARNGAELQPNTFGKLREPILVATHLWRAFDGESPDGVFSLGFPEFFFNQAPLAAPSVFNFFSPDFTPQGIISDQGLVAPEFQIATDTFLARTSNFLSFSIFAGHNQIENQTDDRILIDLSTELALADDPEELISHLDILLMAGQMSDEMRDILFAEYTRTLTFAPVDRITNLLFLIMSSPQYAIQK